MIVINAFYNLFSHIENDFRLENNIIICYFIDVITINRKC